ncbi:protein-tyrosine-phosphatase [Paraburkholderia sp. Tr-20389]|uniref:tyrosine-protein phosphatase n=1 Tax=Paraburkholderia sp. Tr-20389 TaxID=2703903 RepID=UPI001981A3C7|nr:tyrosine-protein phosphatase [Paraburkholderia sp. Tr-20389]MBN3755090.1 protein-tyrosine-phosphatase [Paraburkholderia sp. Tr-20389]
MTLTAKADLSRAALHAFRASPLAMPDLHAFANAERASRRRFLKGTAGALLLSGMGSSLLTACGGTNAGADQAPTPRLASLENFRDVGGTAAGYPTVDGRVVRRNAFFRANALTENTADAAVLDSLGITAVYDLRTPAEIDRAADMLPANALYQKINVTGHEDVMMPAADSAASAVSSMEHAQRFYVTDPVQRAAFGSLLTQLATTPGPQLIHSSAGKDRAGWAAALLLSIANVPFDVIMQDYLLSNTYLANSISARVEARRQEGGDLAASIEMPLASVQSSYLQASFDQVQASYGTMSGYLTRGLGLMQSTVDTLRDRLLL